MNVYETFVNVIKLISKMMCEAFNYDSNDSNGIDNNGIPFNQLCTLKIFFLRILLMTVPLLRYICEFLLLIIDVKEFIVKAQSLPKLLNNFFKLHSSCLLLM